MRYSDLQSSWCYNGSLRRVKAINLDVRILLLVIVKNRVELAFDFCVATFVSESEPTSNTRKINVVIRDCRPVDGESVGQVKDFPCVIELNPNPVFSIGREINDIVEVYDKFSKLIGLKH